jgi:hypothetical protein
LVRGIELFKAHFKDHHDKYVLIGGTACEVVMKKFDIDFRATKDLDIVLFIELLDTDFFNTFWEFIKRGEYQHQHKSTGAKQFYRFQKPSDKSYPYMIELFARQPDALIIPEDCHLTPIPASSDASSLSAILLNDVYYNFIKDGIILEDGLSVVSAECLIPLKAKAYIDLKKRKEAGEQIDSANIRKHGNDIIRLSQVLTEESNVSLSSEIKSDMIIFIEQISTEDIALKSLGLRTTTLDEILSRLRLIYNLA